MLLFLVVAGLYFAKEFLIPLAIGAIIATLFLPFCKWLEQKKVPRIVAVFICVLILVLFIAGFFTLIGWQISSLTNDIELIKTKSLSLIENIQQYIFKHFGFSSTAQAKLINDQQNSVTVYIEKFVSSFATIVTSFILTILYVFLLLYYRIHLKNFILMLFPDSKKIESEQLIYQATNVSQQYLVGLSKMIFCLWIMYGIGFSIIGVHNAIFFAILCGLLEIVPFIGNITGTSITVLVAVVHGASLPMIIGIVITYGVVQFIQGWILEPLILGPQVKINPLFTILALVLGQLIWGIPGIVLAIPITAMFKIFCDYIEPLKPLGFLIGEIQNPKSPLTIIAKIKSWFKRT
jgi:predicted PurR-regulated permease PerM